ncbi:unnamed protein product [marine sediment metagenome]|uniref:Uncharacterized protein n=1 Tax=marine sediment metagenome TaxID=412755 RepID=X0UNF7_9ZZZZ
MIFADTLYTNDTQTTKARREKRKSVKVNYILIARRREIQKKKRVRDSVKLKQIRVLKEIVVR